MWIKALANDLDNKENDLGVTVGLVLEGLGFTGWIKSACIDFIGKMDSHTSEEACIEELAARVVRLLAPGEDISEICSNTVKAIQILQTGQETHQVDTLLVLVAPLARVCGRIFGLDMENASTAQLVSASARRLEAMGFMIVNGTRVLDLSRFMPVVEPFGVSRKGAELLARLIGMEVVEHWDYPDTSSAGGSLIFDSGWTGVSGKLTRNWFLIQRWILTTLLILWLNHRSMLRLWAIGLVMAVTVVFVKSLLLPFFQR